MIKITILGLQGRTAIFRVCGEDVIYYPNSGKLLLLLEQQRPAYYSAPSENVILLSPKTGGIRANNLTHAMEITESLYSVHDVGHKTKPTI